ncbi:hypothetical protein LB505_004819 [Fusarium chuoi]|nr:hypothetical protein LB505_004819 [Fusarium chuoi]
MVETVISTGLIGSPGYGHGLVLQSRPKANMKPLKQDYESSTPTMGYMDMATATGEMRYPQEASTSLTIEPSQPSSLLNLFHPPVLSSTAQYPQDGSAFFQSQAAGHHHLYPGIDVRSRLGSKYVLFFPLHS